jgi:mercuric ion transport protein
VVGAVFAALCCLGFAPLITVLTAIGLGFLINDAILIPLLVVFLLVTVGGLYLGMRRHGQPWPLLLGAVSAVVTVVFIAVAFNKPLALLGVAGLIVSSILNVWLGVRWHRRESRISK